MRALRSRLAVLITSVLLLGVAGCGDVSAPDPVNERPAFAPAEVVTDVFVVDVDFTDFAACTSEPVHWTGTAHVVIHEVSNRGAHLLRSQGRSISRPTYPSI